MTFRRYLKYTHVLSLIVQIRKSVYENVYSLGFGVLFMISRRFCVYLFIKYLSRERNQSNWRVHAFDDFTNVRFGYTEFSYEARAQKSSGQPHWAKTRTTRKRNEKKNPRKCPNQ